MATNTDGYMLQTITFIDILIVKGSNIKILYGILCNFLIEKSKKANLFLRKMMSKKGIWSPFWFFLFSNRPAGFEKYLFISPKPKNQPPNISPGKARIQTHHPKNSQIYESYV